MFPTFETERFIMREMVVDDVDDMYHYCSNVEMMKFTSTEVNRSKDETLSRIKKLSSSFINGKGVAWAIEEKTTGRVIGDIGLYFTSPDHKKAGVGFNISPEYWNKGYCTEALILVIKYALIDLGVNRLEATCKIDNIASQRVMEKAGTKYEGTLRQYSYKDGYYHDVKMFSIIRSDIKDEKYNTQPYNSYDAT